jgi:elongation factor Tu
MQESNVEAGTTVTHVPLHARPVDIEAEILFLSTQEGGRSTPTRSGYRAPHDFGIDGMLNDAMHEYPDRGLAFPGETVRTLLRLLAPEFQIGRLHHGFAFTVREGACVVARGRVTKLLNRDLANRAGA